VTASFAFGSADLYAWLNRNQDVRMLRTETVNDPARIARPSVREDSGWPGGISGFASSAGA
jgi:acyl-CoA hydrolase